MSFKTFVNEAKLKAKILKRIYHDDIQQDLFKFKVGDKVKVNIEYMIPNNSENGEEKKSKDVIGKISKVIPPSMDNQGRYYTSRKKDKYELDDESGKPITTVVITFNSRTGRRVDHDYQFEEDELTLVKKKMNEDRKDLFDIPPKFNVGDLVKTFNDKKGIISHIHDDSESNYFYHVMSIDMQKIVNRNLRKERVNYGGEFFNEKRGNWYWKETELTPIKKINEDRKDLFDIKLQKGDRFIVVADFLKGLKGTIIRVKKDWHSGEDNYVVKYDEGQYYVDDLKIKRKQDDLDDTWFDGSYLEKI